MNIFVILCEKPILSSLLSFSNSSLRKWKWKTRRCQRCQLVTGIFPRCSIKLTQWIPFVRSILTRRLTIHGEDNIRGNRHRRVLNDCRTTRKAPATGEWGRDSLVRAEIWWKRGWLDADEPERTNRVKRRKRENLEKLATATKGLQRVREEQCHGRRVFPSSFNH